jgi:hypothetical protein
MSDYLTNLIQRERTEDATKVQPHRASAYVPILQNPILNSDSNDIITFEEQDNNSTEPQPHIMSLQTKSSELKLSQSRNEDNVRVSGQPEIEKINSKRTYISAEVSDQELSPRTEHPQNTSQSELSENVKTFQPSDVRRLTSLLSFEKEMFTQYKTGKKLSKMAIDPYDEIDKGKIEPREENLIRRIKENQIIQQTAPTIRVSIGRIEIRAITQSVNQRTTSSPVRPKISLEDYLRRRDGGNQ